MTTKQNAVDLANTARSFIARLQINSGVKISAFENDWNICVKQAGFTGVFDVPNGYKRRAHFIVDLERMALQLDDYVEPRAELTTMTVEQQIREFNAALTRVLDVEEAHAEALEINDSFNCAYNRPGWLPQEAFADLTDADKYASISLCHTEALEFNRAHDVNTRLNSEYDDIVAERKTRLATLCRGFSQQYQIYNGGPYVEKLYAVLPDGRVFRCADEFDLPNNIFNHIDSEWKHIPALTIDDLPKMANTTFCGNYEIPQQCHSI